MTRPESGPLLDVVDLRAEYRTGRGVIRAVDGISFSLRSGECLAIVGESGSGKSAAALSLMRLLPDPPGRVTGGRVLLRGRDLLGLPDWAMPDVRGREMAMIFQEPGSALNPVLTVGRQVAEAAMAHHDVSPREARRLAMEALAQAGVPAPGRRLGQYPHQLSGGLKQRVMIAMALVGGPALLIADEPTTALDVTVQARILDLLVYLQHRLGLGILLITHDLAVVAAVADRVAVLYAGRIIETASAATFFHRPVHPYSRGLMAAARLARDDHGFRTVPGAVPDLLDLPEGCRFAPRCRQWQSARVGRVNPDLPCDRRYPPERRVAEEHTVHCWLAEAGR